MGRHAVSRPCLRPAFRQSPYLGLCLYLCLGLGLGGLHTACASPDPTTYNPFARPDISSELLPKPLSANRSFDGTPKKVKVRVYADHEHRVQSRRWTAHFQDQVDLANEILIPEFGVELEVVDFQPWTRQAPAERLHEILDELEARDSGADVDWVVGLASALSSVSTSMHELGVARPLGRHIVLRGYSDIAERKALGDDYKEELFKVRRRHKQATLLLHEWAHTLGALHLASDDSKLMNTYYSKDITGFTLQNGNLIRAVLEVRLLPPDERSEGAEALALRRYLADTPPWQGWLASDYEATREMLDRYVEQAEKTQPGQAQSGPGAVKDGIPGEAQAMYRRVRVLARDGKLEPALAELDDLLQAYPAHAEFRVAACELWLKKDGPGGASIARCQRVAELDASNPTGDLLLARAHIAAGDLLAAHEALSALARRAASLTELPEEAQKELWTAVLGTYQAMPAVTWAEAALAGAPGSLDLHEFRAWATATRRRYGLPPAARRHKISPAGEAEYLAQVRAVLDLTYAKKYSEAKKLAVKALGSYPGAPGLLGALCDLELRMRQFAAARARCVKALAGHDEASWPRYLLGIIELRNKRNRAGIDHLNKAIVMDPDLRQAYHALYKAYERVKDAQGQDQVRQAYMERFGVAIPAR